MEETLEAVMNDMVLVLARRPDRLLEERLVGAGIRPLVTDQMQEILAKVPRENPLAVIVTEESEQFDLLELVLNIRDIDAEVPIILLGDERSGLVYQPFLALGCICLAHPDRNGGAFDTLERLLTERQEQLEDSY